MEPLKILALGKEGLVAMIAESGWIRGSNACRQRPVKRPLQKGQILQLKENPGQRKSRNVPQYLAGVDGRLAVL